MYAITNALHNKIKVNIAFYFHYLGSHLKLYWKKTELQAGRSVKEVIKIF